MWMMKLFSLVTAGLVAGALALVPGTAAANIVQLGQTATPLQAPQCPAGVSPSKCYIILTRTTAVQTTSDGAVNPTVVKKSGWIVAFTVGLSRLSTNASTERTFLHTLDSTYGGTPQLELTVMKPGPKNRYTIVAQTPTYHVLPYLGLVLQQPLSLPPTFATFTALPVKAGDVIGLTVLTWAPVLSYNLSSTRFSYRQSRMENCKNPAGSQTAQLTVGESTRYLCQYAGTRVEYTASEVVNTPYPKNYVH